MKDSDNKYVQALIRDSKQGNKNSFKQLIDLYIGATYLFCYRMLFSQLSAEEVTKEVFKKAWKNINKMRNDVSFANWIMGFTVFEIIRKVQQKIIEPPKSKQIKEVVPEKRTIDPNLSNFEKLILKLEDDERRLFLLHDVKKYSYTEIADLFSKQSIDEIINPIKSAREKLAKGLVHEL
jgi:RNA polymerase sigma-70 factor, ECF subfamily